MASQSRRLSLSVLVTAAMVMGLLLFPGPAMGLTATLESGATSYLIGEQVTFTGSVGFSDGEYKPLSALTLTVDGEQPLEASIPVTAGTHTVDSPTVPGELECTVTHNDVTSGVDGYAHGYANTTGFYGSGSSASLGVVCVWESPVFLDPAPIFSLVPATAELYSVPAIPPTPTATPGGPDELPEMTERFAIPLAPTPEAAADAPSDLPGADLLFTIPLVPTPEAAANAFAGLPTMTEVFSISPVATPTPIAGVVVLPSTEKAFDIPGGAIPKGLTTDGTHFYILVSGNTSDKVIVTDLDGVYESEFSLGRFCQSWNSQCDLSSNPNDGQARQESAGITYLDTNQTLYVADNTWMGDSREVVAFNTAGVQQPNKSFSFDGEITGLNASGGSIYALDGDGVRKLHKSGTELEDSWISWESRSALAMVGDVFVLVEGLKIQPYVDDGNDLSSSGSGYTTDLIVQGAVASGGILYLADLDSAAVHKAAMPTTVEATTEPLGLATDGTNLFLLLDGEPVDGIQVVTTAGVMVTSFDAPTDNGEGLHYQDGSLWYAGKDNNGMMVWELNPSTGAVLNSHGVSNDWGVMGEQPHGLAGDGDDLLVITRGTSDRLIAHDSGDGDFEWETNWNWPDWENTLQGPNALAKAPEDDQYLTAKNDEIQLVDTDDQMIVSQFENLDVDDIQGIVMIGDNIYVADADTAKIYGTALSLTQTYTTNPLALAHGRGDDSDKIYILVEGDPSNWIIQVDATTGAIENDYAAPRDGTGMAYVDGSLYFGDNDSDPTKMLVLNPATGAETDSWNLQWPWGGEMWDNVTSVGTDGTDLVVGIAGRTCTFHYDTDGDPLDPGEVCNNKMVSGPKGISMGSFAIGSKNNKVVATTSNGGTKYSTTLDDIEGQALVGSVLFLATDGDTDNVYRATLPSGAESSAVPKGLANDGTNLYILVEAAPADKVVKTTLAGVYVAGWDVTDDDDYDYDNADGIVYHDGNVYVLGGESSDGNQCCGPTQRNIIKYSTTGTALDTITLTDQWPVCCHTLQGIGSDGDDLYIGFQGVDAVKKVDTDGDEQDQQNVGSGSWMNGVTALAIGGTSDDALVYMAKNSDISRYAWDAPNTEVSSWEIGYSYTDSDGVAQFADVGDIQGMTLVGDFVYIAEDTENKVYFAAIPAPSVTITNVPQATATDGTYIYAAYDGEPVDRIAKFVAATGVYVSEFAAPVDEVNALTYFGGTLYAAAQGESDDFWCWDCPGKTTIYEINPATGVTTNDWKIQSPWSGEVTANVGGMTNDGTDLILSVSEYSLGWWIVSEGSNATEVQAGGDPYANQGNNNDPNNNNNNNNNNDPNNNNNQNTGCDPNYDPNCNQNNNNDPNNNNNQNQGCDPMYDPNCNSGPNYSPAQYMGWGDAPYSALEYYDGNVYTISNGDALKIYDADDGDDVGSASNLENVSDAVGLAYIGTTMYVTSSDGTVRGTTLAANMPELTVTGDYVASLSATWTEYPSGYDVSGPGYSSSVVSADVDFSLDKVTEVVITLVGPENDSVASNELVAVTGTLNDLSITQVSIGLELAFTNLFGDGADNGGGSTAKWTTTASDASVVWHIHCDDNNMAPGMPAMDIMMANLNYAQDGNCSWRYSTDVQGAGQPTGNFQTAGSNSGTLVTKNGVSISSDTQLQFASWYESEGATNYDQKLVEVSIDDGANWQAVLQIADFQNGGPPSNAHSSFQTVFHPVAPMDFGMGDMFGGGGMMGPMMPMMGPMVPKPIFEWVDLNLGDFDGETALIRFKFDSIDGAINEGKGWFVDAVSLSGSGGKQDTAAVPSCLVDGVVVTTGCAKGEFAATTVLAEGQNTVALTATSAYAVDGAGVTLKDVETVAVFLDTTAPTVNFAPAQSPVNTQTVAITGSYLERTFDFLQVSVDNSLGEKVVYSQKPGDSGTPDEGESEGTFSTNVPLAEGLNTITVEVNDDALRMGTATTTVVADFTAPTVTVLNTVYPIGVTAARAEDPFVFQVNVEDTIGSDTADPAGIQCVEFIPPDSGNIPNCEGPLFDTPESIPDAVRATWGATGDWLMPGLIPAGLPPGQLDLTARVVDNAGNVTYKTLTADIVAALPAINLGLMPDFNLKSLPLIPDDTSLTDMLGKPALASQATIDAAHIQHVTDGLFRSPDGTWAAYVLAGSGGSAVYACEWASDCDYTVQLTYGTNKTSVIGWSADGSQVIYTEPDTANVGSSLTKTVNAKLFQTIESITYYDAPGADCPVLGTACWHSYTPGPAPDNLTELTTGKGYWFLTRDSEYVYSDPLPGMSVQTPAVINLSYTGEFLTPGVVPGGYPAVEGWNLLGMHSENNRQVSDVLSGLSVPERVWTSTLVYKNEIIFPIENSSGDENGGDENGDKTVTILLGSFSSLGPTDEINVGEGMWVRVREGNSGTIVP